MTKAEFIQRVSKKVKLSKSQTANIVDTTFAEIQALLKRGDSIAMTGVGTFLVAKRKARKGRNPRTGEALKIKASSVPRFRPGKHLKAALKKR